MDLDDTVKMMVAGGMAGSIAKTITAPLSRLTILYQVQAVTKSGGHFKNYRMDQSLLNIVRDIHRQEGLLSFWRGNLTAVIHRFPYSAVNFAVYDVVKKQLRKGINLLYFILKLIFTLMTNFFD
jgi:solute carrier family 25 phosphate transporter 23/24/25/41